MKESIRKFGMVEQLKNDLVDRIKACNDARTLILVLELLEQRGVEPRPADEVSMVEEPPAHYGKMYGGGWKPTKAHLEILEEVDRRIESGEDELIPYDVALKQILDNCNGAG